MTNQTSINEPEDQGLVQSIAEGVSAALLELYFRYSDILMGTAFQLLQNKEDAEDLLHDVFLEVWNKAGGYDPSRGTPSTWLKLITRSRALDRKRIITKARAFSLVASEDTPRSEQLDMTELVDYVQILDALDCLDEDQKIVLTLNYFEGLSCREIALKHDVPVGTVKFKTQGSD